MNALKTIVHALNERVSARRGRAVALHRRAQVARFVRHDRKQTAADDRTIIECKSNAWSESESFAR